MNWSTIERQWSDYKVRARMRWRRLSENELAHINGKHYDLSAKIQQAYGLSRQAAELQIAHWVDEQEGDRQQIDTQQIETQQIDRSQESAQWQAQFQS